MIAIPNDRLLQLVPQRHQLLRVLQESPTTFCARPCRASATSSSRPALINRDFSDIKATMIGMGYAMMGTAIARGENAPVEAARQP